MKLRILLACRMHDHLLLKLGHRTRLQTFSGFTQRNAPNTIHTVHEVRSKQPYRGSTTVSKIEAERNFHCGFSEKYIEIVETTASTTYEHVTEKHICKLCKIFHSLIICSFIQSTNTEYPLCASYWL